MTSKSEWLWSALNWIKWGYISSILHNTIHILCLTNDFPTGYLSFTLKAVLINSVHWIFSLQRLNQNSSTVTHTSYGEILWHGYENLWSPHIRMRKKGPIDSALNQLWKQMISNDSTLTWSGWGWPFLCLELQLHGSGMRKACPFYRYSNTLYAL